jgi:putative transposase
MKLENGDVRKRCQRWNKPLDAHELTFGCYKGLPLFINRVFCDYLITAIAAAQQKHDFDVWAYVIMPNHVHLLIFPVQQPYSVSVILKSIKQSVARKAVNWLKEHRPELLDRLKTGQKHQPQRFWQDGGGYDRNIASYRVAKNSLDYIHMNPVRANLVEQQGQWAYSSFLQVYTKEPGLIEINHRYFPWR